MGGAPPRGVVAAASYEARTYGVRSAMPMVEAMRLCPHAVVVSSGMGKYAAVSREFFAILDQFSPLVEGLSLDEAFLDVTGEERLLGDGRAIAQAIKRRVRKELELVASVGVAPTKFVAKIASDLEKPDGLVVVEPGKVLAFLHPLPVSRLWGVGKVAQEKLAEIGLRSIGDVAGYPESGLRARLGPAAGAHLAALARGEDPRRVEPDRGAVSIGHEETFPFDLHSHGELVPILLHQADRVAARLRRAGLRARVVVVKIKYGDFKIVTRRHTLPDATSDGGVLGKAAVELVRSIELKRSVRLCGVAASGLEDRAAPEQLTLDQPARKRGEQLGDVLDQIQQKFGTEAIGRAIYKDRK